LCGRSIQDISLVSSLQVNSFGAGSGFKATLEASCPFHSMANLFGKPVFAGCRPTVGVRSSAA
jgi:hypothetical protein